MEIIHTFGQNVRLMRTQRNISQELLAEKSGLHRTYIGSVERGERNITLKIAEKIAKALGTSLIILFSLEINTMSMIDEQLIDLMKRYQLSFNHKRHSEFNNENDILMNAFGISPELKRQNPQYWGRELGMLWQLLVINSCSHLEAFKPALKIGNDEPCDLRIDQYAIDTKYRVGSGDSGTLKKFRLYANLLKEQGYEPVVLFLREDNLIHAERAFSDWIIYKGQESFDFIKQISGYDLKNFLEQAAFQYQIIR